MFFKKKKQAPTTPTAKSELRGQYRKRNSKSQPLEATLRVPKWEPLHVELVDLSVRGAGVRVPFAQDRNLKAGDVVELVIGSMMRDEIVTPARVANVATEGESHIRYGFEFLNIGNLYGQLDDFYARHFNRRKSMRVLPALDRKILATLRWGAGEEMKVNVFDIATNGVGVALTKDCAARVAEVPGFEVSLKLPGQDCELSGRAVARHRTPFKNQVLLGLEFDKSGGAGFERHTEVLRAFVEQRAAEMSMWEKNWG